MTSSAKPPKRRKGRGPGGANRTAENDKFHNFKVCKGCGAEKRMADFDKTGNWRKYRAADPRRYKGNCKDCIRAPSAVTADPNFKPKRVRKPETRKPTKKERLARLAAYRQSIRIATRVKALEYVAEKGCCECGTRDPRVLEFDHIDTSRKVADISRLFSNGQSWGSEKLRREIRKCRVICANCHRVHTTEQQGQYKQPEVAVALAAILRDLGLGE